MKFSTAVALSLVVASVEGLSTSYFQTVAGARATAVEPRSYAPSGVKPKAVVNNMGSSYLNNVNRSPSPSYTSITGGPTTAAAAPAVSAVSNGSYLGNLVESSTVATSPRGKFSAFSGKKPKAVVNSMGSSYLNKMSSVSNVVSTSASTSSAPSAGSYLSHLSGSSSTVESAPLGRFSAFSGKKPKVVVNNMGSSYLNKVSGQTRTTSSGPSNGSYLSNLNGASSSVASARQGKFSAFSGKKPKVVVHSMGSSYLNKLRQSSISSTAAPPSGSGSYLGNLGDATVASIPRGRFSAFTGKKPKAVVNNMGSSYLNGIRSGSSTSSLPSYSASPSTSQSVAVAPRGSYSPFSGKKPKAVINNMGSSYLNNVGRGISSFPAAISATPVTKAAPTTGSYLLNLNGSSSFRISSVRGSYSPAGKKPKTVVNNMGSSYLNAVNSGKGLSSFAGYSVPTKTFSSWDAAPASSSKPWAPLQPLTKSYSFAGANTPAAAVETTVGSGSYLESLGGGRRW